MPRNTRARSPNNASYSGPITRKRQKVIDQQKEHRERLNSILHSGSFPELPTLPLPRLLMQRRLRQLPQSTLSLRLLPTTLTGEIVRSSSRIYNAGFSADGSLFYQSSQEFNVKIYKVDGNARLRHIETMQADYGRWTVTDTKISSDNEFVAYSADDSVLQIGRLGEHPQSYDLSTDNLEPDQESRIIRSAASVWSLAFSPARGHIATGNSAGDIALADFSSRKRLFLVRAHSEDVNSIAFFESHNPHLLCSGGDDCTIRLWDTRIRPSSDLPVGSWHGHTEGITHVAAKGDGRYLVSNGKDQKMKLWDVRKISSSKSASNHLYTAFDYRYYHYPHNPQMVQAANDLSVMTYMGHTVYSTLIRCAFSPLHTTGQRYLYTGSADGSVYIYNLDGTLRHKLYTEMGVRRSQLGVAIRDVSWHPSQSLLTCTYWTETFSGIMRFDHHEGESVEMIDNTVPYPQSNDEFDSDSDSSNILSSPGRMVFIFPF
ncbi:hypothetical protein EC988_000498 [Linderina pennispora]|nr:hypothetical protein EC988_000498 [Linderina pennispora]